MKVELTKEQIRVLIVHVDQDISYGAGGTFYREDPNDVLETIPDKREIKIAKNALETLRVAHRKFNK